MKEYRQYKVGDRVVALASTMIGTVTTVMPSDVTGRNAYMVKYDDSLELSAMDWQLAAPDETVYTVVVDDQGDDGSWNLKTDSVYRSLDKAKERVKQIADSWRDLVGGYEDKYEVEQDDTSFLAWLEGEFTQDHYAVVVNANRLE